MGFPCRPLGGGGVFRVFRLIYMAFPCRPMSEQDFQHPPHGIPMYMTTSNLSRSFPERFPDISGKVIHFTIKRSLRNFRNSERGHRTGLHGNFNVNVYLWCHLHGPWTEVFHADDTNLSGRMTDMLWIPLAVILWTPMPANWCQVDLPS